MDIEGHLKEIAGCVTRKRHRLQLVSFNRLDFDDHEESVSKDVFEDEEDVTENSDNEQITVEKQISIEIVKADKEEQTVTGVVLQPEVVDAQGDIMSPDVIKKAAYKFLQNYNRSTKLGIQHSTFPKGKLALVESYLTPMNMVIGVKSVKQGSWIMTVKVLDAKLWGKVKEGGITGFSIGGKAKVIGVAT